MTDDVNIQTVLTCFCDQIPISVRVCFIYLVKIVTLIKKKTVYLSCLLGPIKIYEHNTEINIHNISFLNDKIF